MKTSNIITMKEITYNRISPLKAILHTIFKKNVKVSKLIFAGEFDNKSLRESISYLKEIDEFSEEILIRIIEETNQYHLSNYNAIQTYINSHMIYNTSSSKP